MTYYSKIKRCGCSIFQVPTLSQWFHDMSPFFPCCMWQEEQAVGCETYRFERRPSQDCVAYQSPYVGMYISIIQLEYGLYANKICYKYLTCC